MKSAPHANILIEKAAGKRRACMNEDKRAEWFGAVLSLLYEFNWPMSETEISNRSMKSA